MGRARKTQGRTGGARRPRTRWETLPTEELLDLRLCDLGLRIEGTALEGRVEQLNDELTRAGLRFHPYVWLSTDWFTPDAHSGFAIPFFLAHPRLARLEHRQMFEVEGGSHGWCMKLLRHEAGHAFDNAYRLHWRKRWRETFGRFSEPYRDSYVPRPTSKKYVLNLDHWYAQSHPAEDYAETFAVWLRPGWRKRYAGWPTALRKLEFMDELMTEIGGRSPVVRSRAKPDSLSRQRQTLREYYEDKKTFYAADAKAGFNRYLLTLFSREARPGRETAAAFLRRHRQELRTRVAQMTRQLRYVVDQALNEMIARCRELGLRAHRSDRQSRIDAAILLTILTMSYTRGRRPRYRR